VVITTRLCATLPPVAHGREHQACLDRTSHHTDVATGQRASSSLGHLAESRLDANALMKEDWMDECDGRRHFAGVFLYFHLDTPRFRTSDGFCIALPPCLL
jgi:hypothetical protein